MAFMSESFGGAAVDQSLARTSCTLHTQVRHTAHGHYYHPWKRRLRTRNTRGSLLICIKETEGSAMDRMDMSVALAVGREGINQYYDG